MAVESSLIIVGMISGLHAAGTKNPVIFGEVGAGRGYQHCKFGHEILRLENDSAGSVSPWTFQTVEETAIGQCGQTFCCDCRPGGVADQSLQAHPVLGFDTDIRMHTEAGDHRAPGALESIQAVSVDFDLPGARRHGRYWSRPQSGGSRSSPAKRPCRDHPGIRDLPLDNRLQFQDPDASVAIACADSPASLSEAHLRPRAPATSGTQDARLRRLHRRRRSREQWKWGLQFKASP